jgi:tetratricopeptide (TPR) repeat protein
VGGDISSVYSTLASFYFEKKNTQQAISLLNKAIELNPTQLEYYAKRGKYKAAMGLKAESERDFAFIKSPTQVNSTKKSEEYFKTKITEYTSANKNEELFATLKEAIKVYPDNAELLHNAFKFLMKTKDQAKCAEFGALFQEDNVNQHLFKSMAAEYANDSNLAYKELELVLKSGATLYDIQLRFIDLPSKSYYCKLLFTYASTTNNSFVPRMYDKVKIKASIDSIYENLPSYKNASGMTKNIMDKTKLKQIAKDCGNYSEYLDLLDNEPLLLEMSPSHALNKIECLVILNRKDEAIKFAKKVVSKGKMQLMHGDDDYIKINNNWIIGVNNIAKGPCN